MLGAMVETWGVKGVLFDVVVAGEKEMNCKVWVEPDERKLGKKVM